MAQKAKTYDHTGTAKRVASINEQFKASDVYSALTQLDFARQTLAQFPETQGIAKRLGVLHAKGVDIAGRIPAPDADDADRAGYMDGFVGAAPARTADEEYMAAYYEGRANRTAALY